MFKRHWNKRRKINPGEPCYISLCYILEGSGEDEEKIEEYFNTYIPKEEYDFEEKEEMVEYLKDIASDRYE